MQNNNNNYGFGRMSKDLFGNEVDNNAVNDIELYPYENYNDIVLAELRLHEENVDNPHQVTCNQIKAVSFDVDQTPVVDSTEKALARKNIGLDRVVNTSDTDEPILDSDLKFTSGGAYQLKQATIDEFKISRAVESELTLRADNADSEIKQIKEDIDVNVSELKELITTEQQERIEADFDINTRIDEEIQDRKDAVEHEENRASAEEVRIENKLDDYIEFNNQALSDEKSKRQQADTILQNSINTEENRAKGEEGRIDDKLDTEISDRINDVKTEKNRATSAETALNDRIDNLDVHIIGQDGYYLKTIKQDDGKIIATTEQIENEWTQSPSYLKVPSSKLVKDTIDTETSRAQGEELRIETKLDTEISDRINDVKTEKNRAITAETLLQDNLDTETERALASETILDDKISTETTRAKDAENILQATIEAEETRAKSAERDLGDRITTIENDYLTSTDKTELEGYIGEEAVKRENADEALDDKISDLETITNDKIDVNVHIEGDQDEITYNGDTVTKTSPYKNLNTGDVGSRSEIIHLANNTTAGLMSYTDYQQIRNNTSRIENLEGKATRLMYSEKANPSANEIKIFVDNYLEEKGISPITEQDYAGVSVIVEETSHVWYYYFNNEIGWHDDGQDTVSQFTNDIAGIIKGTNSDGFVFAENNGTGSVKGWSELKTRVSNLETNTVTNINYNTTTKTIDKTINGTTTTVVSADTLKQDMNLDSVVNTGDSDTPVSGGITKFTTGGAYTELNKKVNKVEGKGLSTNDFTNSYKEQVDANTTDRHRHNNETVLNNTTSSFTTELNTQISNNTTAINNIKDGTNIDSFSDVESALNTKVDKSQIGYVELTSTSGTLTDEQYAECLKDMAFISIILGPTGQKVNTLYYKYNSSNSYINFLELKTDSIDTENYCVLRNNGILVNKTSHVYNEQGGHNAGFFYDVSQTNTLLDNKQNTLVSGTNIKTINNISLLGSGNIDIGESSIDIAEGTGIDITTESDDTKVISIDTTTVAMKSDVQEEADRATTNEVILATEIEEEVARATSNEVILHTQVEDLYEQKQDVLTATTGIEIDDTNNIKVTGSEYKDSSGTVVGCLKFVKLTQAQYNALSTKDSDTLYIIVG